MINTASNSTAKDNFVISLSAGGSNDDMNITTLSENLEGFILSANREIQKVCMTARDT